MRVLYDLSKRIAGFDFFCWLVMQKALGGTEVVVDASSPKTDKFTIDEVRRRVDSIVVPGAALAGMVVSRGKGGTELPNSYHQADLVRMARERSIPRLRSVMPPGGERYTVTLRTTRRWPNRNSRESAWRDFAREIGALVIEDYDVRPIHLHERMALYAGAEMNFFVTNGPVMLCFLSEYPAMGFCVNDSPMTKLGIPIGGQYPFMLPDRHRQIYEHDTPDNIRRHFEEWRRGGWKS